MSGAKAARIALVVAVLLMVCILVLQLPVDVPDANSPLEGNHAGLVNDATTLGQTFVANRNGLHRVEVTLSVERPAESTGFVFRISEVPWKLTREVALPVAALPIGKLLNFRPGTIMERWYSIEFDPISDSAGKQLFFEFEGKDVQGPNSLGLMMFFHNEYPLGEAFINGSPANAHVVFRAYSQGRLVDLLGVLGERMASEKPGLFGNPLTYGALGLLYVLLAGSTLILLGRGA